MNPGPSVQAIASAPSASGEVTPDYVLELERAARYLPPEQVPLLRQAWQRCMRRWLTMPSAR